MGADSDYDGGAVMDYSALKTEIDTGPLAAECAGCTDEAIAAILNRGNTIAACERFVSARTILAEVPAGATILDKLEAAAATIPDVKWAMKFLQTETGIDVGHATTRAQIDALVTAGVLTETEGAALKNLALKACSRAEIAGFGTVTAGDVSRALRGPY